MQCCTNVLHCSKLLSFAPAARYQARNMLLHSHSSALLKSLMGTGQWPMLLAYGTVVVLMNAAAVAAAGVLLLPTC